MYFAVKLSLDHEGKVPEPGLEEDWRDEKTADREKKKRNSESLKKVSIVLNGPISAYFCSFSSFAHHNSITNFKKFRRFA